MKIPKAVLNLIESFEKLPGIGPKTAQRLTFYLLHNPQNELDQFAKSLIELKAKTQVCTICKNIGETSVCSVCDDSLRDKNIVLVVSSPLDVFAMEKTGFKGVYHVLHGVLDPLNNIGPDELYIADLIKRVKDALEQNLALEVILATNTSMEGESTAMYISKLIREDISVNGIVKITRIARGLPVGGDIEYADEITLSRALEGRLNF